jgi:hypothetical protein
MRNFHMGDLVGINEVTGIAFIKLDNGLQVQFGGPGDPKAKDYYRLSDNGEFCYPCEKWQYEAGIKDQQEYRNTCNFSRIKILEGAAEIMEIVRELEGYSDVLPDNEQKKLYEEIFKSIGGQLTKILELPIVES